jgi:hypothetical protein
MLRLVLFFLPATLASVGAAQAVVPPGYEPSLAITVDPDSYSHVPAINARGQIVFSKRLIPYDDLTSEIFLYDQGTTVRLTDDYVRDELPDINDSGEIVWSRGIGTGGTLEIVRFEDGALMRLTDDGYSDWAPRINNDGWIVWYKWIRGGCLDSDADVFLFDGTAIRKLTNGGYSHQSPALNNRGEVVWQRCDFCNQPWTSTICIWSEGCASAITGSDSEVGGPQINDAGLVVWAGLVDLSTPGTRIFAYQDGTTSVVTEWGSAAHLNNCGDLAIMRWHDPSRLWQQWLYHSGQFYQLTAGPLSSAEGDINDRGDIAFSSGDYSALRTNIHLLRRRPAGDLNCDGTVDVFDIDPFVMALTDATYYQAQYADCDPALADLNLDGCVNVFDIDPFVDVLTR